MAPLVIDTLDSLSNYVGREIATTEWLQISQAQIQQFADATGDHNWIHIDAERARKESPYGTTIAHGFLTLSLISQFMSQSLRVQRGVRMTINYGLNRVRFPSPVRSGTWNLTFASVRLKVWLPVGAPWLAFLTLTVRLPL